MFPVPPLPVRLCAVLCLLTPVLLAENPFLVVNEDNTQVFKGKEVVSTLRKGQKLIQTATKGNWVGVEWESVTGKVEVGWVRSSRVSQTPTYEVLKDAAGVGLTQVPTDGLLGKKQEDERQTLLKGNLQIMGDWRQYDKDGSGELNLAELVDLVKAKGFVSEEPPPMPTAPGGMPPPPGMGPLPAPVPPGTAPAPAAPGTNPVPPGAAPAPAAPGTNPVPPGRAPAPAAPGTNPVPPGTAPAPAAPGANPPPPGTNPPPAAAPGANPGPPPAGNVPAPLPPPPPAR